MWHVWISSLGVTAAIILAGGYVLLQVLKERYRFRIMLAAIERGITNFPESTVPSWYVSMRQAVAVLVLGIGLMLVGGTAWTLARNVNPPKNITAAQQAPPVQVEQPAEPAPPAPNKKAKPAPKRPPHRPPPPPPNPELERWHQAQQQQIIGQVAAGAGLLIALLGIVRVVFAVVERKQFRLIQQEDTQ